VKERDRVHAESIAKDMLALGLTVVCTRGTGEHLQAKGLDVAIVHKVREGRPHVVDFMKDGKIQLVFNTTEGAQAIADSSAIRRTALFGKIPYSTTITGARAMVQAIAAKAATTDGFTVAPLQSYFKKSDTKKSAA